MRSVCLVASLLLASTSLLTAQVSVTTSSNDTARTGQNLSETILTTSNVNSTDFGKLFSQSVDGYVYAQPLYLPSVTIGGAVHSAVFVATEHDSVYAFDANSNAGANASPLWFASLLTTAHGAASGATTVPSSLLSADISPEVGITGTPVIDSTTGTLYVVSKTMEGSTFVQRLHALDVTSGAEKFGGPVVIAPSVAGTGSGSVNGKLTFDPEWENQRPGLLLLNGVVYVGFAAHGDNGPWHGWILGYSAATLKPTGVFCASPNGVGSGVWMTGVGLAAEVIDSVNHPYGRMFIPTGNGDFTASSPYSAGMDYGDSILNLDLSNGVPTVQDEFTPADQASLDGSDGDLGSGGIVILPTQSTGSYPHLLVQAGKSGEIYMLNREGLGGYHSSDQVVQGLGNAVGNTGSWNTPAYWNGTVYYWGRGDNLKAFPLVSGKLTGPTAVSSESYGYPGANPSISANGTSQGIVWSVETDGYGSNGPAILQAHNASNVATTLYSSATDASRDQAGPAVKFVVPTVANGKVYVGTQYQLDIYGLLNGVEPTAAPVLSPGTETFSGTLSVSMTDSTSGAVIHYTTNGSAPTASSTTYSGPIAVSASETISAIAIAPGFSASPVATATYTQNSAPTSISFPVGFASSQGLMILNGSTDLDDSRLQLTDGGSSEAGSAWFYSPVNVQAFSTTFTFQLSNPLADGMTFAIQGVGTKALGSSGAGLGYQTIGKSIAIKFDLYSNAGEGPDSTGLYSDGASPTVPAINLSSTAINLHSDDTMQVQLSYNGSTLTMVIEDIVTGGTYSTSWAVNIPSLVGGNTAYVGFTGGTGGNSSSQKILTWSYTPGTPQLPALAAPTFSPAAGTYTSAQSVKISDATTGTTIYYTTNGSTPTTSSAVYSSAIAVSATETLKAIAVASGYSTSTVGTAVYTISSAPATAIATPVFSVPGGTYNAAQKLTLSDATTGATLYYTLNGTTPTSSSNRYTGPISLVNSVTIQAIAMLSGGAASSVASATYTLVALPPTMTPAAGTYTSAQTVTLATASPGVKIFYTTNGAKASASSTLYTDPIAVTASETINAIAVQTGWTASADVAAAYNIATGAATPTPATPTFSPAAGTYTSAQTVTISTVTAGSAIRYTTNGTTPTSASAVYSGPITVSATETLEAIAIANSVSSAAGTAAYTIASAGTSYISYASGGMKASGFSLNGGATVTSAGALQLTDGNTVESRSAWFPTKVPVAGFTTDFTFQQLNANADGMTFTIQADGVSAVGTSGGGLGYEGIPSSVAVKFDLHSNAGEGVDSTGLYADGAAPTVPSVDLSSTAINLHSGDLMHAHLVYDGTNLTMTLTDTVTNGSVVEVFPVNLPSVLGGSTAWVGFTGGTGGTTATQNVLSWTYSSD
jgi:hypothetical protein